MMIATTIPDEVVPEGHAKVRFGPPEGYSEDHCYSHDAIVSRMAGGPFDGMPVICIRVELEDGELERLADVGALWMTLLTSQLPPWILEVADGQG